MRLVTDFRDFYDRSFDGAGDDFVRVAANAGPDKPEQFRIMKAAGFQIPPVGTLSDLYEQYDWAEGVIRYVVAYTDQMAHVGEGKERWQIGKWVSNPHMGMPGGLRYPDKWATFCSAFVPGPRGVSWRLLQVGRHRFWIEYTSETDWRSNCGEGDITLLESQLDCGYHPYIRLPLFAIDFVHGAKDMYAVDFNVAPGVRGSGVGKVLPADLVVEAIETAHRLFASEGR